MKLYENKLGFDKNFLPENKLKDIENFIHYNVIPLFMACSYNKSAIKVEVITPDCFRLIREGITYQEVLRFEYCSGLEFVPYSNNQKPTFKGLEDYMMRYRRN